MSDTKKAVVIGGGHASAQLIETLRENGWRGEITLIAEEPQLPYQRPPLSKAYLAGEHAEDWLLYRPADFYREHAVNVLSGRRAVAIDRDSQQVVLDDKSQISYDKLALTTGCRVRKLPLPGADGERVYYLRSIADVDNIRGALDNARHVAIIGGGFIGLEVAATLRGMDIDVTVLEAQERVLARVVAPQISAFFTRQHRKQGVRLHIGANIGAIHSDAGGVRIDCDNIESVRADMLIIGIGVIPNTELAEDAGLACDNGIVVDEFAQTADPNIVAAGDCTSFHSQWYGRRVRMETVHNAVEQAKSAAISLCGLKLPHRQVPWVWSDQYALRLQAVGSHLDYDQIVTRGDAEGGKLAVFYFRDGRFIGMNSVNRPADFGACRRILEQGVALTPAQAADPQFPLESLVETERELLFEPEWNSPADPNSLLAQLAATVVDDDANKG